MSGQFTQPAMNGTEERLEALLQAVLTQNELLGKLSQQVDKQQTYNLREPAVPPIPARRK